MSTRGLLVGAVLCLLAVPQRAGAAPDPVRRPPLTWIRGDGSYTKANRGLHSIHQIVIHATDGGSLDGNVWWLSGGHSHASAHYVIGRDGSIVQLVHLSDIAWHAGNWRTNLHSIGIEHVGDTNDPAGFTLAQYRSSAMLVAWLVRRYDIPVDRQHIIGHYQVPDPNHPGEFGGADHHTDPGPYWRWGFYMNLVRHDAFPWRYRLQVQTTSPQPGDLVSGVVPWRVKTKGVQARRVDFLVDGKLLWSDERAPFAFAGGRGLNTTSLSNGRHLLAVRAIGDGKTAVQDLAVEVHNNDFAVTTSTLRPWEKVRGWLRVAANVRGARTTGIGLYVDGHVVSRDRTAPFRLRWDSRHVHDGRHVITIAATAVDGRIARRRLPVVVSNHPRPKRKAKPKPLLPPQVTAENLADGSTVSGTFVWRVHTVGPVARLEYLVDGTLVDTETREPWAFSWDTTGLAAGPHAATVRAVTPTGASAELSATVTVAAPG